MTWRKNMTKTEEPTVSSYSGKDFVKVTFKPQLSHFHIREIPAGMFKLFEKRVLDLAGTCGIPNVWLNGAKVPVKNFKSYVELYFPDKGSQKTSSPSDSDFEDENKKPDGAHMLIHEKMSRWEMVCGQSESGQFQQVSFVNSICTSKGGQHVNHVVDPLVQAILDKVRTKNKKGMDIKPAHVKNHLWMFVNCQIVNPTFDSQTKDTMTLKPSLFGSCCQLSARTVNQVLGSSVVETVLLWAAQKEAVDLQRKLKAANTGRQSQISVPKLDDALLAGTKRSHECTLIVTEGDSAKTSCLAGLSVVGKDKFGVFPLRGKLLNVRDASHNQLLANEEIQNLMTIMGLSVKDEDKMDVKGLRYGAIMIMTDQDFDGSHIKGLIINFIHRFWPRLMRVDGFVSQFVTPIVKVTHKVQKSRGEAFFTLKEYQEWLDRNDGGKNWTIKYYKGLGTSTDKEFKNYFAAIDMHKMTFEYVGSADGEAIDMAFNSKRVEDRKAWMMGHCDTDVLDHSQSIVSYQEFVNKELVQFSKYDVQRSIPSVLDGFKPGQRKVLFGVMKKSKGSSAEFKVAQLSGYVAEHSAYHHGEVSIQQTIINMAQKFVGTNNINVLEPCGQFGSRSFGGKDASAARYIFTKLSRITPKIYHPDDEPVLNRCCEDGQAIEPHFYMPVIPMTLVNGADGIGTGWSTFVPNFNPRDIISNLRLWLEDKAMYPMKPFYRKFKGTVEMQPKGTGFDLIGLYEVLQTGGEESPDGEVVLRVTELPPRIWTEDYKKMLEEMRKESDSPDPVPAPKAKAKAKTRAKAKAKAKAKATAHRKSLGILSFLDASSHEDIRFDITMTRSQFEKASAMGLEKVFKLRKSFAVSNMTLFDRNGKIQRYATELDILREFAKARMEFYHRRKAYLLISLVKELEEMSNRARFIKMVVDGELVISRKKKQVLMEELYRLEFTPHSRIVAKFKQAYNDILGVSAAAEEESSDEEDASQDMRTGDFNYLLSMALWNLTYEKVEEILKETEKKQAQLAATRSTEASEMWEEDLISLETMLDRLEAEDEEQREEDRKLRKIHRLSVREAKKGPKRRAKAKAARKPRQQAEASGVTSGITSLLTSNAPSRTVSKPTSPKYGLFDRVRQGQTRPALHVDDLLGMLSDSSDDVSRPTAKQSSLLSFTKSSGRPTSSVPTLSKPSSRSANSESPPAKRPGHPILKPSKKVRKVIESDNAPSETPESDDASSESSEFSDSDSLFDSN